MDVEQNLILQRGLYGATLGERLERVTGRLGLSQAAVARVIGLSAPMLSQLASGRRIKIGNPQAAARFQGLLDLADEVDAGLPHDALASRLDEIASEDTATLTRTRPSTAREDAAVVSGVLRAVASGRELESAADLLQQTHPGLAEVIRVYGTGAPAEARRHLASISHLLAPPTL